MNAPKKLKANPAQDLMALASQAASMDERLSKTLETQPSATGQLPPGAAPTAAVIPIHSAAAPASAGQGIVLKVERAEDLAHLAVGQIIDAPQALVDLNPLGPRVHYTEEIIETITGTFGVGQDDAAHGYVEDGRVKLIDGGTRWHASQRTSKRLHVKIEAAPENKLALYMRARQLNETRSGVSAIDFADSLQRLLTDRALPSQVEIAAKVPGPTGRRMSEETVSKYLRIASSLPESIKDGLLRHQETAGFSTALEFTALFQGELDEAELKARKEWAIDLIDKMNGTPPTKEALSKLIKDKLQGPSRRERSDGHKLEFGAQKGAIKLFPKQGKLTLALEGVPAERLAPMREKLEAALKEFLSA